MKSPKVVESAIKSLVGHRIRSIRKSLRMSQESLALKSDLDRTYVTSIENGKRNVSIVNLERLSNALGYSLKELFDSPEFEPIIYHPNSLYAKNTNKKVGKVAENEPKQYD